LYLRWSKKELEALQKLWPNPKIPLEEIYKVFPDRSRGAVAEKAHELGIALKREGKINEDLLKKLLSVEEG